MNAKSVCMALSLISASACGGGGGDQTTGPPAGNTPPPAGGISVTNNAFSPSLKTVAPGTTVQWAWNTCSDGGIYGGEVCVAHGVNFADGINSPTQERGTFSRNFATAGSYPYNCAVHGPAMSGTITVQ